MRVPSWLRPFAARPNPVRQRRPRPSFRPRVERLEDRVTPSTGGLLDPTFGSGGIVTTSFSNGTDRPYAVVAQPDGKLVVAGSTLVSSANTDMLLARYNVNGARDPTFGSGGHVTTDFFKSYDVANAVALQPQSDGSNKVLAAGYDIKASGGSTSADFALVRYNANGTLDTTFGTGGKVTTDLGSTDDQATSMVVQPDGKVVLAGYTHPSPGVVAALVRYNANGSLDTSFGSGGKLVTAIRVSYDTGVALQSQPDGSFKLIIAGQSPTTVGSTITYPLFAVRLNANGTLDSGFGAGGEVTTLVGLNDPFGGLAV
jgi:uncharacterized delta-60 repeat protein